MILLVDIGNSRLKWALLEDRDAGRRDVSACLLGGGAEAYEQADPGAVFQAAWHTVHAIRQVRAVCVAGDAVATQLRQWVAARWGAACRFLHAGTAVAGVRNAYRDPARLGADRWAALIGARSCAAGRVCVIDCGTAVTIDVLDAQGIHQGGLIAPGLALMRNSLLTGTVGVGATRTPQVSAGSGFEPSGVPEPGYEPGSERAKGDRFLGIDTRTCVDKGTELALRSLITQVLSTQAETGGGLSAVFTGGDAPRIMAGITLPDSVAVCHIPDLVLRGLAQLPDEALETS